MKEISLNTEYNRKEISCKLSVDVDFIVDNPVVVALIKVNGKVKAKGIARCNPDDTFNEDIGANIAARRAVIEMCGNHLREWYGVGK